MDTYAEDVDITIDDVPLYQPDRYFSQHTPDAVFLAAGAQKAIWQMIEKTRSYGINEIYMLHDIAGKNHLPLFDEKGKRLDYRLRKLRFSELKPTLPYFEMPIVDDCNLNCKGCLFSCNPATKQGYVTIEEIEHDFRRMRDLFHDIPWIRILGGEPFLHPNLGEVLEVGRNIFPDTEIDVCTNGLLVLRAESSLWDYFRKNRITMHISGYPPTYKMMDAIEICLKREGIEYYVLPRNDFYKFYTVDKSNDAEASHAACPSSGCRELYRGRFLKCSAVIAFERFNQQFKTRYVTKKNEDYFDIHDENLDGWKIVQKLNQAVSCCGYCNTKSVRKFPWANGKKAMLEDYIL